MGISNLTGQMEDEKRTTKAKIASVDDSLGISLCSKPVELAQMAANVRNAEDAALNGVENFGLRVHGGLALLRNRRGSASVGGSRSGTRHRWAEEGAEETRSRMGTNNGHPPLELTTSSA
jgi:hypothetical protein